MNFRVFSRIIPVFLSITAIYSTQAAPAPKGKLLWDYWYTVKTDKTVPYEYYEDKFETDKSKVHFENHAWKKEEDFINEEQIGAITEGTPELTPLFWNFRSTYRSSEKVIDGNIKDGKVLTAKIRDKGQDLPIVTKTITPNTILSSFFPLWLGIHMPKMKVGQSVSFQTILEDKVDAGTVSGIVRMDKPDAFASKTSTIKLAVDYGDQNSIWYVEKNGALMRSEIPEQRIIVERVPESVAKKFLTP